MKQVAARKETSLFELPHAAGASKRLRAPAYDISCNLAGTGACRVIVSK